MEALTAAKGPLRQDEQGRLTALAETEVVGTAPEAAFDDLTRMASELCEAPVAALTLIDAERQVFKSAVGMPLDPLPRSEVFCSHTICGHGLFEVPDARADGRFAHLPMVVAPGGVRYYAGLPLRVGGHAVGSLCLADTRPRRLAEGQVRVLERLARQATAQLELRRAEHLLTRHERLRGEFTTALSHELRTPLTAILGFTEMLADGDAGPVNAEQADMLRVVRSSGERLYGLIQDLLLASGVEQPSAEAAVAVEVGELVERACQAVDPMVAEYGASLMVKMSTGPVRAVHGQPVPLARVLVAVLRRALGTTLTGDVRLDVTPSATGVAFTVTGGDERSFADSTVSPVIPGLALDEREIDRIVRLYGGDVSTRPGLVTLTLRGC